MSTNRFSFRVVFFSGPNTKNRQIHHGTFMKRFRLQNEVMALCICLSQVRGFTGYGPAALHLFPSVSRLKLEGPSVELVVGCVLCQMQEEEQDGHDLPALAACSRKAFDPRFKRGPLSAHEPRSLIPDCQNLYPDTRHAKALTLSLNANGSEGQRPYIHPQVLNPEFPKRPYTPAQFLNPECSCSPKHRPLRSAIFSRRLRSWSSPPAFWLLRV